MLPSPPTCPSHPVNTVQPSDSLLILPVLDPPRCRNPPLVEGFSHSGGLFIKSVEEGDPVGDSRFTFRQG